MKKHKIIIDSNNKISLPSISELWRSRELLIALVLRDIQVRYKQSFLGIAWAGIQPFMMMVVFSIIFGNFAKIPSEGVPYPVFSLAALLPWQLFAKSLSQGSTSLVSYGGMMSKVYFPRLFAPLSVTLAGLIDFLIAFVIMLGVMAYYDMYPSYNIFFLPIFILLALFTSLSIALLLSGVNVKYRDIQHTLPFIVQIWMFATPIVYPLSMVPEAYRYFYVLNPMAGVVEGFRWALLDKPLSISFTEFGISIGVSVVLFILALLYFNRVEKVFVDRL